MTRPALLIASVAFALASWAVVNTINTHTITRTPAPCQHAATSAWSHLHALTDESGTRVPIEAIHADMAGLRACR